jgi:antitoxin component of RelBE/YafQ-DinJ toxin-antitoxin module
MTDYVNINIKLERELKEEAQAAIGRLRTQKEITLSSYIRDMLRKLVEETPGHFSSSRRAK